DGEAAERSPADVLHGRSSLSQDYPPVVRAPLDRSKKTVNAIVASLREEVVHARSDLDPPGRLPRSAGRPSGDPVEEGPGPHRLSRAHARPFRITRSPGRSSLGRSGRGAGAEQPAAGPVRDPARPRTVGRARLDRRARA